MMAHLGLEVDDVLVFLNEDGEFHDDGMFTTSSFDEKLTTELSDESMSLKGFAVFAFVFVAFHQSIFLHLVYQSESISISVRCTELDKDQTRPDQTSGNTILVEFLLSSHGPF